MLAIPAQFLAYGLAGLLAGSFIMSLVFVPGFVEALIPIFIGLGFNPVLVFALASAGSIAGGITNYYFGFAGLKLLEKFGMPEKKIIKEEKWLNKWGIYSILVLSFIPGFPFDLVAILVGFFKMDLKEFILWMSLGKLMKFGMITFGVEAFIALSAYFGGI